MGEYSTISAGSTIHCASSDYRECSLDLPSVPIEQQFGGVVADIHISDFVTIGAHSCVLPGAVIPEGASFGAYTLIKANNNLFPYHLYVGNTCKDLGERSNKQAIEKFKLEKKQ